MNLEADPRFKIAAARRILHHAGLDSDDVAGHVTARIAGDDTSYWTTALECFDLTTVDSVVKLAFDVGRVQGGVTSDGRTAIEAGGPLPVSTAAGWIGAVYRARPDVQCLIHTHAPHIAAVSSTGTVVGLYHNRTLVFYDEQAFYEDDGLHTDSPEGITAALGDKSVLIMRNHGALVVGDSIEGATMLAVLLEKAAQIHILAKSVGGVPFAEGEHLAKRKLAHRGSLAILWQSHLRRLRRSDPDLFPEPRVGVAPRKGAQEARASIRR